MAERRRLWLHGAAGVFVAGMAAAALAAPSWYHGLVQEDGPVEWATVGLFLVAGGVRLVWAVRERRVFDGLVALFCLFVAGEEISWGQRLLGYTPPEYFLERNVQQEANLHNFADVFGRPGLTLAVLLAGYGLLLPLTERVDRLRRVPERIGATAPSLPAVPWFALAAGLLVVYPLSYTGEWVEALAGGLFLATAPAAARRPTGSRDRRPWTWAWATAAGLAAVMTLVTLAGRDPGGRRSACAGSEAEALLRDLVAGDAARPPLATVGYVHKRIHTAAEEGYIDGAALERYRAAPACPGESGKEAERRRRYGVDPWGMSYWVVSAERPDGRRVAVYSFGPNQRRDGRAAEGAGDDVVVYAEP